MVSSVYFNPARSPVTVTLKTGEATLVRPKGRLEVTVEQDRSPSILRLVQKGILKRLGVPSPVPVPIVPAVSEVPSSVAPEKAISPIVERLEEVPKEVPPSSEPQEVPTISWSRSRLMRYAQAAGLNVDSKASKAEVLRAIQEVGS